MYTDFLCQQLEQWQDEYDREVMSKGNRYSPITLRPVAAPHQKGAQFHMIRMELQIEIKNRSVSVSKQLRNYPSPSPRFIVTRYQLTNTDIERLKNITTAEILTINIPVFAYKRNRLKFLILFNNKSQ